MRYTIGHYCKLSLVIIVTVLCASETVIGLLQLFGICQPNHALYAVTGSFRNPGPYGGFLAVCISLLTAFCFEKDESNNDDNFSRILHGVVGVVSVVSCCSIPLSQSRSAFLALGVSLLLLCFRSKKIRALFNRYLKKYTLGIVLLSASIFVITYAIKKPSADGRFFVDKLCVKAIGKNGINGSGIKSFGGIYSETQADYFKSQIEKKGKDLLDWTVLNEHERMTADCPEYAFNEFLQLGIEKGLIAMSLSIFLLLLGITTSFKRGTIWCYGLVSLSLFACFSYPFHLIRFQVYLLLLLIACLLDKMPERPNVNGYHSYLTTQLGVKRLFSILLVLYYFSLLVSVTIKTNNTRKEHAKSEWQQIESCYNKEQYDYVAEDCEDIFPLIKDEWKYLFMYGNSLNKVGAYEKSDSILKMCANIRCEPLIWNIMGDNSLAIGDYRIAEERYMHAFYMVPNRMRPLYSLAKLYYLEGDTARFLEMANKVESFKPKIESIDTNSFRLEIRNLKNNYLE